MKKTVILLLAAFLLLVSVPHVTLAKDIQLNEFMGAERFVDKYNEFCKNNYFDGATITRMKYNTEYEGYYIYTFYYGYGPNGGDGLGQIFTNASGYMEHILISSRPGVKTTIEAIMASMAVVTGLGYPPMSTIDAAFNTDFGQFYCNDTGRYYSLFRDPEWEFDNPNIRTYHISAHD
ncbi:hypothetical protein [Anaerovibrio lipolyticus]|uniref:hypothetical protein n=1 Tax=Anaerovibrio lipolyticus TaxID=82374 RepID=UPI0025FAC74C|nr:hypothetical protein [Anaerovibrio lipolyticus]